MVVEKVPIRLYNTLTRKKEIFKPIKNGQVGMYTCGPTVYWSTHIGHMSKYVGDDVLRRVLGYNGYKVKHVMNITDVGHLTSDADEGEDKLEKGARREGATVWEVAKKYEGEFFETMDALNVLRPHVAPRATEHIADQIKLIERLEANGYTYETDTAVYFNVDKFPGYWVFARQRLEDKKIGARDDVVIDPQKKNSYDFALWFKRVGRFANHVMHWDSPWGDGFPGWHLECSAMSMKYLGESFDIHTGGVDHIGVHHPAEIAQSEGATGKKFVNYWIHRVFILVDGQKMSKSLGNFYTLEDVKKRGFDPMALRYLFLTGHYRSELNFTWDALKAAETALNRLRMAVSELKAVRSKVTKKKDNKVTRYQLDFLNSINDDLNLPQALAVVWEVVKKARQDTDFAPMALELLLDFDKVLGLRLDEIEPLKIPTEVRKLVKGREKLRREGKFDEADKVRNKIKELGFDLEDTEEGTEVRKSKS